MNRSLTKVMGGAAVACALLALAMPADAAAVRDVPGFTGNTLARNDDQSTGAVNIGFTINFFGLTYDQLFVNNNGNVTFNTALSQFTPDAIVGATGRPIIAPFFADIDTRSPSPGVTQYGNGTVNGRPAFGVNYIDVGYYNTHADKLFSGQLILIDRSDIAAGDFDIEFNFDKVQWNTGDASGGTGGFGGTPARSGYGNGSGVPGSSFELAGSGIDRAFIDSNLVTGLIHNSINSDVAGRYIFQARNGEVLPPPPPQPPPNGEVIPLPAGVWAGLSGLAMLGVFRRFRRA